MNHLSDEELILHYYGDIGPTDQARIDDHLARCGDCKAAGAQLESLLQLVETRPTPEPGPGFEREVWARLEPHLESSLAGRPATHRRHAWIAAPRWALASGVAALLVLAFAAGRFSGDVPVAPPSVISPDTGGSERVLQSAVGDHLDRSQMMLVELVNADSDHLDASTSEQSQAADLVSANRLFRQSAEQSGDTAIADILDDLERVLLEVANAPADVTSGERADLKSRIATEDLLFRVRVIASEMRLRTSSDREGGDPRRGRPRTF
jgi:hypothetical protein